MSGITHLDLASIIEVVGYPGISLMIFLESGVLFGFFLPGASLLFTAGILASIGIFSMWTLLPLLSLAGIAGDSVGYWTGIWLGDTLYKRPHSRFFRKTHLDEARMFFQRHGAKAIFLARFIPVVRTFTPMVAGAADMHYWTFLRWNVFGGILWVNLFVIAGYALGHTVPASEQYLAPISIGIIVITLIPVIVSLFRSKFTHIKPQALMLDLDETLAPNFQAPDDAMIERIEHMLSRIPVAIITGASYDRVYSHVAARIKPELRFNLYLFPTSSAEGYRFKDGAWHKEYAHEFSQEESEYVLRAIEQSAVDTGILNGYTPRGQQYFNRSTQIAYTFLGIDATQDDKYSWDQDGAKRRHFLEILAKKLPAYEVHIGGRTSIDITKKDITKAHGVGIFSQWTHIPPQAILYIGDALFPGGNDAVVIPTGVHTTHTSGPAETAYLLDTLHKSFQ